MINNDIVSRAISPNLREEGGHHGAEESAQSKLVGPVPGEIALVIQDYK